MTVAYRFGSFELQPDQRRLLAHGDTVPLGQRAFDVLRTLIERRERLVAKNELLDLVWPGVVVEENNVQVQISTLRKLLGPQAIATVPGRGYRFTAALDGANDSSPHSVWTGPVADTGKTSVPSPLTNLPKELPALYGREGDLQALSSLIDRHRLVTVVGAGGIGKSRVAQAAAHSLTGRWRDGVWIVELAGLSDPELLANAVARALHITMPGQDIALDELVAGVAQRNLLLVLDNCEHLLDAAAALVQAMISRAPNVVLLATSQEPLRVATEQQYRLTPLAVPTELTSGARQFGAIALFEARVQAADPRFALNDDNLPVAIDICRRLDGLPLAIELAAARVATLGVQPVRDKLDARFKLLTGGSRATLRRHQTLRAALEWSHNLLTDAEQAVFRRLGVFAGGFTMEMAQAVAGDAQLDEWAVLDHLSALVDKSLVVADAADAPDAPRYRLLESARAFALEQLAGGETAEVLRRHAVAMRDFLQQVDDVNLDGELRTDQYAALVLPELDNLRAAHMWATGEQGDLKVAIALAAHAGSLIDYAAECADWLAPLRPRVEEGGVDPAVAARYWRAIAAGNMTGHVPLPLQVEAATRAASLYQALGQPRRVFSSLIQLSRLRGLQRDLAAASAALDQARNLIRSDWPAEFHIRLLRSDGMVACEAGRVAEAIAFYRDAVRISASTGDWRLEAMARNNLVDLLWHVAPIDEAAREAYALAEALRVKPAAYNDMDILFTNLLGILSEMGRIDEASAVAGEVLPLMRRTQRYFIEEWVYLFWRRGQLDVATRLLGATDAAVRSGRPVQRNEERLIAEARAALEHALPPDVFTSELAAGAALNRAELLALITDALAKA